MLEIEEKYLQQLRDRNLYVSTPFSKGRTLEGSVWVAKPTSIQGNCISGYNGAVGEIPIDAPAVLLRPTTEGWVVLNQDHIPELGPGDFKNVWQTEQEAIDDIIAFYFGNSERMDLINQRLKLIQVQPRED